MALIRDGALAPELLLVLRHSNASFGDSYVFPGGLVEAADYEVWSRCDGLDAGAANARLDLDAGGLAYYSAAIRELFEEAGILLAKHANTGLWPDAEAFAAERDALNAGRLSWPDFLDAQDLRLVCDALIYFEYWVTPREIAKRFATRFFLAISPPGQSASHCGRELTDSRWLTAAAALSDARETRLQLPRPTQASLETLGDFGDLATMVAWAERRCRNGVACKLPAVISVDGKPRVVMPGDQLYPDYEIDDG
ncbi:MAG: NUDIX hydrolase [Pseudomonadota bacterium]